VPVNKVVESFDEAVKDVFDGAVILFGGFAGGSHSTYLIQALARQGAKELTVVINTLGFIDDLCNNKQVKKGIASFLVVPGHVTAFENQLLAGEVEGELVPQGTLAERVRANKAGMSFFSHDESFAMIRGGHIDLCGLGGLQVSEKGDLANWLLPGRVAGGIGGGMDLAFGAKKVIVAMEHTTKDGKPKIVNKCTYELTAPRCVSLIVTDIAVIEVTKEGLVLKELAPGWRAEEVQALTEPKLIIAPDLKEIELM